MLARSPLSCGAMERNEPHLRPGHPSIHLGGELVPTQTQTVCEIALESGHRHNTNVGDRLTTLHAPRPYEAMNITNATGLTAADRIMRNCRVLCYDVLDEIEFYQNVSRYK